MEEDFQDLNQTAEELLREKNLLEAQARHMSKRETVTATSNTNHQQMQRTIDDLQRRCATLQTQLTQEASRDNDGQQLAELQHTINELTKSRAALQARLTDTLMERDGLKGDTVRLGQEMETLRQELRTVRSSRVEGDGDRLRGELQSVKGQLRALELENAQLAERSVQMERVDVERLQIQDETIARLQETVKDLTRKITLGKFFLDTADFPAFNIVFDSLYNKVENNHLGP